jgi:hypothetical protein
MAEFLNKLIKKNRLITGAGDPVVSVDIHREKGYAVATVSFPA